MNGNISKALKKLSIDNPTDWDEHLLAVLYAYKTKAHYVLKMSPYESMFGISPPSSRQDPLQLLGRALDMERLTELNDRNVQIEEYNVLNEEYDYKQVVKRKTYAPGTKVVRVRHNKFSKWILISNLQYSLWSLLSITVLVNLRMLLVVF